MKFRCASNAAIKNVEIARKKINFFSKTFLTKSPFFNKIQILRLEEFYSYTEKIQQKRTRKTKQNKGKLCTANNYIQ